MWFTTLSRKLNLIFPVCPRVESSSGTFCFVSFHSSSRNVNSTSFKLNVSVFVLYVNPNSPCRITKFCDKKVKIPFVLFLKFPPPNSFILSLLQWIFFIIFGVINALWQIAGIFLALATYKLETLHYYVNVVLSFFLSSVKEIHWQYATSEAKSSFAVFKIIHIYGSTGLFWMSIALVWV